MELWCHANCVSTQIKRNQSAYMIQVIVRYCETLLFCNRLDMPNCFYFNLHIYQLRWFQQREYVRWLYYHRRRHRHNHMADGNIKTRTTQNIENVVQRSFIYRTFEDALI